LQSKIGGGIKGPTKLKGPSSTTVTPVTSKDAGKPADTKGEKI
jgi:hypothetical protein